MSKPAWLVVALVLLAGCAAAQQETDRLVDPISFLEDAEGDEPAQAQQNPGEVAAQAIEAQASQVEQQAQAIEDEKSVPEKTVPDSPAPASIPKQVANAEPNTVAATPASGAAQTIAESPEEAAVVASAEAAPSKAHEEMSEHQQKAEAHVALEKAAAATPSEADDQEADAGISDGQPADKFGHIMNPAKETTPEELANYKVLSSKLKSRKSNRLQREKDKSEMKALRTQAESKVASARLTQAEKHLSSLRTKYIHLQQKKEKALRAGQQVEQKIQALHHKESDEQRLLTQTQYNEEKAKGMRVATTIQEEMQGAIANTGGDGKSLEHSSEIRKFNNEEYQKSQNASKMADEDAETKQKKVDRVMDMLQTTDQQRHSLNEQLYDEDHVMAGAKYDIEQMESDIRHAEERVAQEEAIAGVAKQHAKVASKEVSAAKANLSRDTLGSLQQVSAEALDPELAQETAVKEVMDQDGLGDDGKNLVAKNGDIARQYERLWRQMPLPSPSNPLLDAVSRAAVKDPPLPRISSIHYLDAN